MRGWKDGPEPPRDRRGLGEGGRSGRSWDSIQYSFSQGAGGDRLGLQFVAFAVGRVASSFNWNFLFYFPADTSFMTLYGSYIVS